MYEGAVTRYKMLHVLSPPMVLYQSHALHVETAAPCHWTAFPDTVWTYCMTCYALLQHLACKSDGMHEHCVPHLHCML